MRISLLLLLLHCLFLVHSQRPVKLPVMAEEATLKIPRIQYMREHRSVDDIGCIPNNGSAYSGKANTTENGGACQQWSLRVPHNHTYTYVGEHNYCRDTEGDSRPWCYTSDPGTRWERCNVPFCITASNYSENANNGLGEDLHFQSKEKFRECLPTDGSAYAGQTNTTESGLSCQQWPDDIPHDHDYTYVGEHNYCRNPSDSDKPWCYTTDPNKRWEYCDLSICPKSADETCQAWKKSLNDQSKEDDIGCQLLQGGSYTGQASTTISGLTCQMWTVQAPHTHGHAELGEHNYCRNPSAGDGVWCYTTDPNRRWEYCDVPFCDIGCQPSDWTPYSGEANTTISGRICQMWSDTTPNNHNHTYVGHHNFCRNPSGGPMQPQMAGRLWCYTTDPEMSWDYCMVGACQKAEEGEIYTKGDIEIAVQHLFVRLL